MQKKDTKEKIKAALPGLLRKYFQLKGRNSLRSNSLPFLTPKTLSTLNAPTVRPGDHSVWMGEYRAALYRAAFGHRRRCVRRRYCQAQVRGDLFERSEFEPRLRRQYRSSTVDVARALSFWYLFLSGKRKKKYTHINHYSSYPKSATTYPPNVISAIRSVSGTPCLVSQSLRVLH